MANLWRFKGGGRGAALMIGLFLLGMASGAGLMGFYQDPAEEETDALAEVRSEGYLYTRPLLECEVKSSKAVRDEVRSFSNELKTLVDERLEKGAAKEISVYYRDLNNGPWIAINREKKFIPASLMKVSMMISLFRKAEKEPGLLQLETQIPPDFPNDWGQTYQPTEKLKLGEIYNVDELIRRMIVYSDNGATALLNTIVPDGYDNQLFKDLGISFSEKGGRRDWISVESYASFFRVLYNASYLNRDNSEKALSLLSQTSFPGLRSGIPKGVDVAEKFGHFELDGTEGRQQLHSCGIVYHEAHPYLLCVMTRGNDLNAQRSVITELSSSVYGFVNSPSFRIH